MDTGGLDTMHTRDFSRLRVLLFGAFGNGNLGDMYQALAVRHHLLGTESVQRMAIIEAISHWRFELDRAAVSGVLGAVRTARDNIIASWKGVGNVCVSISNRGHVV